ncbi:SMP-30/gluconolactonase/LRE family protein [Xanthomonas nasturtii]|uniref:SMP-30/gluconolactonase/LRE family protein n=1 Tax=Xanthomonas nasturtii TaxID=1843581 RepID=UPI002B23204A|nr:SMP-30/gluconolactonase/LRE family protein [Xanthomonas nasturtii]
MLPAHSPARCVTQAGAQVTLYDQARPGVVRGATHAVWSEVAGHRVLGWREDGAVDVLLDAIAFTNGDAVDAQRPLVPCAHGRRAITSSDAAGRAHLLVGRFEGKRLKSPNAPSVARDGAIWFADPPFGLLKPARATLARRNWTTTAVYRRPHDAGPLQCMARLDHPNGLAFSPDARAVSVANPGGRPWRAGDHRMGLVRWCTARSTPLCRGAERPGRRLLGGLARMAVEQLRRRRVHLRSGETPVGAGTDPAHRIHCSFGQDQRRLFIGGGSTLWMRELG